MSTAKPCTKCGSPDNYNFALNNGLCDPCIGKELDRLKAELAALQEATRWIPVKERLPEDLSDVFVYVKKGWVDIAYYRPNEGKLHKFFGNKGQYSICAISHWRPATPPEEKT